jgi:hypothetical protein
MVRFLYLSGTCRYVAAIPEPDVYSQELNKIPKLSILGRLGHGSMCKLPDDPPPAYAAV